MKFRSTYAFDKETISSIKELSNVWKVSQSETIRISIRLAKEREDSNPERLTPSLALELLMNGSGIKKKDTAKWKKSNKQFRNSWNSED